MSGADKEPSGRPTREAIDKLEREVAELKAHNQDLTTRIHQLTRKLAGVRKVWTDLTGALMGEDGA